MKYFSQITLFAIFSACLIGCQHDVYRSPLPIEGEELSFRIDAISSKERFSELLLEGETLTDVYSYEGSDSRFYYISNTWRAHIVSIAQKHFSDDEMRTLLKEQQIKYDSGELPLPGKMQAPNGPEAIELNNWLNGRKLDRSLDVE